MKWTNHWFLVPSQSCATVTTIYITIFLFSYKGTVHTEETLPIASLPSPQQPWIYFLSGWIYFFWKFYIREIMQCIFFCVSLLSLNIRFLRFISITVFISVVLFSLLRAFLFTNASHFVYQSTYWWTLVYSY